VVIIDLQTVSAEMAFVLRDWGRDASELAPRSRYLRTSTTSYPQFSAGASNPR